jgi:protocatechuate 3,4-dioxygenase, beta subunit
MRLVVLLTLVVLASAAPSQAPEELIPPPYLSPKYVAPESAPSSIVVAGPDEPGERMVVTGRAMDGSKPIGGVSIYVFHADAKGLYTTDGTNSGENARLHGVIRTDADGRYRYETIRPLGYGTAAAHFHHVVTAPGYKPRLLDLWLADDPILVRERAAGMPDVRGCCMFVRPVMRDAAGVWHSTHDLQMLRE